jgi:hypothetical protein
MVEGPSYFLKKSAPLKTKGAAPIKPFDSSRASQGKQGKRVRHPETGIETSAAKAVRHLEQPFVAAMDSLRSP